MWEAERFRNQASELQEMSATVRRIARLVGGTGSVEWDSWAADRFRRETGMCAADLHACAGELAEDAGTALALARTLDRMQAARFGREPDAGE